MRSHIQVVIPEWTYLVVRKKTLSWATSRYFLKLWPAPRLSYRRGLTNLTQEGVGTMACPLPAGTSTLFPNMSKDIARRALTSFPRNRPLFCMAKTFTRLPHITLCLALLVRSAGISYPANVHLPTPHSAAAPVYSKHRYKLQFENSPARPRNYKSNKRQSMDLDKRLQERNKQAAPFAPQTRTGHHNRKS